MMNHQTEALELDNDAMSFLGDNFQKKKNKKNYIVKPNFNLFHILENSYSGLFDRGLLALKK